MVYNEANVGWGRRRRRVVTEVLEEEFQYVADEPEERAGYQQRIDPTVNTSAQGRRASTIEDHERLKEVDDRTKAEILRGVSQVSNELLAIRESLRWGWERLVIAVLPPGSLSSWVAVQENEADEQGVAVLASYQIDGGVLDESERQRLHGLGFRDVKNEMGVLELDGNLDEQRTRQVVARRALRAILEVYLPHLEDWDPLVDWSAHLINVDE